MPPTQTPVIAGIDEAGRGALAGPVVAAACILPDLPVIPTFIRDSKQLPPESREKAFHWITEHCLFGIGSSDAACIDASGILAATESAMQQAIAELAVRRQPTYLLVDGRDHFWFDYPHSSLIRGDQREHCIAAASIIAKVTRDRLMVQFDGEFPGYGFALHKGYGTAEHFTAITKLGCSRIHRRTFVHGNVLVAATATTAQCQRAGAAR